MAWYVSEDGRILTFTLYNSDEILLSDGTVVNPDKIKCDMFAVRSSAYKYAEYVKQYGFDQAAKHFNKWLDGK